MEEKNPFKKIEKEEEVPTIIKENLMGDIYSIKLLMEFTDLFSLKFGKVVESFFKTKK